MPRPGSISIFSQSGALCTAILDHAAGRGFGLAKLVSIGNKADISEVDLLTALGDDPQTKVIVGYLESIATGDAFMEAAEEAASKKPVVLMKSGTTQAGQRAASSHTGVLAGTEIAFGAAFHRSGIIRADVFEQILDFATALSMQPLPRGDRVLIITNAGGPGHDGRRRRGEGRPAAWPRSAATPPPRCARTCRGPRAPATRWTCSATPTPSATWPRSRRRRTTPASTRSSCC